MGEKLHYGQNTRPRRWIQGQKNIFGPNAPPPPWAQFHGYFKIEHFNLFRIILALRIPM